MNGFAMRTHSWLQACCPEDAQGSVLPSSPRVVGAIYQPSYIHGNLAKTHQKQRRGDAVLPVAAAGGGRPVSDAAVYAPKQWKIGTARPGL